MNRPSCPDCHSSNFVSPITSVIANNTSYSETHGAVYDWHTSDFVGISTADFYTTSTTALGRNFRFPKNPGVPHADNFVLYWLTGAIASGVVLAGLEHLGGLEDIFAWFFGVICFAVVLGAPIALVFGAIKWLTGIPTSLKWKENCKIALQGFYCSSCNTAFDTEIRSNPTGYIASVFNGTRTRLMNTKY